jgi:DNA modification methylase
MESAKVNASGAPLTAPPKYEPVLQLPPLCEDQLQGLRDSISVHGVLVPILVDGNGPVRKIIDGNYRKQIADELGYQCPEVAQEGLDEEEKRTLARALNLARRHLSPKERRQLIADQLRETPDRTNRWVAKQLGVHHATVASVRLALETTGQIEEQPARIGCDGHVQPARKTVAPVLRSEEERNRRVAATTLICGDCREALPQIPTASIDAVITDPIYPEIEREYGRISESEWHDLMHVVVRECRRVLKPSGSAVFILQPNYQHVGQMRVWLWEFLVWAAKEWNLVQDAYSWTTDALPLAGTSRTQGLLRQSVKMCVWLGAKDCYRNQDNVLRTPSVKTSNRSCSDNETRVGRGEWPYRIGTMASAAAERGGTTPFNLLPISNSGARGDHPATTSYRLASWWCQYLLPKDGVLLDPFSGEATILAAGLDCGASKVLGIEKVERYVEMAWERIRNG